MKKLYEEPEIEVRNYTLPPTGILTESVTDPDLNDGDDYEYLP